MTTKTATKYNIGGVALDRPFKIRRLGHFGFNASDFEASRHFHFDLPGFFVTEPAGTSFFGRHAGDHHSFALFDKKKFNERQYAGANAKHFRPENDINQITWQIQSVSEMAEASKYFRGLGVEIMREGRAGGGGLAISSVRVGRRISRSSNCVTVSSRSTGTAGRARSRCAMARRILPTNRSSRITNWCAPTSKKASVC